MSGITTLSVKIGSWEGMDRFIVSPEVRSVIVGLTLMHNMGLYVDYWRDILLDSNGRTMPCHPVVPKQKTSSCGLAQVTCER